MSIKYQIVCDGCGKTEKAIWMKPLQMRRLLKPEGWVRANRYGVLSVDGCLDYCPACNADRIKAEKARKK